MKWRNEPPAWSVKGNAIRIKSDAKTDFWRKTHYGFIRDSGHFYYRQAKGDLTAEVKVSGKYESLYDQAGLMVRADEANWIKCGIEFVDGVQQASVVVTRDYSDWSVVSLAGNPDSFWLRLTRRGDAIEVHYSLDGKQYIMLRMAYFPLVDPVMVGVMCASPEGNGFEVTFENFAVNK